MSVPKSLFILFVFGAVLGTLCDFFHNLSHTSAYLYPYFAGMAWWVPLLMGAACVAIGFVFMNFENSIAVPLGLPKLLIGLFGFAGMYAISGYLKVNAGFLIVILGLSAIAQWAFLSRSIKGLLLAFAVGIDGCLVEIFLGYTGHFYYLEPYQDLWGIPYWLPCLYLAAAPVVGHTACYLRQPQFRSSYEISRSQAFSAQR